MPDALADVAGAAVCAGLCVALSPYLARVTLSAPDRDDPRWWRGQTASARRTASTAGVGLALGLMGGLAARWSAVLPAWIVLAVVATPLLIVDVERHRLPNRLLVCAAIGGAVLLIEAAAVHGEWHRLLRAAEGGAAVFAVLYLIAFIAPGSFGFGDVKLGGVLGAYLGWFGWEFVYDGIFAGFLLGMLVALVLLATRRVSLKTAVAFGPMLIVGAFVLVAGHTAPLLG